MSSRAAAEVGAPIEIEVEMEEDGLPDMIFLEAGARLEGSRYLTVHTCPDCEAAMETVGVGHSLLYCSSCESMTGRRVEMKRRFELLPEVD